MSKKTLEKKALKGKQAKTAAAQTSKAPKAQAKEAKPNIPNIDRCCKCKSYGPFPCGTGHQCKLTGKPTPRKATCPKQKPRI